MRTHDFLYKESKRAKLEREKLRQREQERRRREAQVSWEIMRDLSLSYQNFIFQQNQIDMNRQSDMMAAFEENII